MTESNVDQPSTSSSGQSSENSIHQQNQIPAFGDLKVPNDNSPAFLIMYPSLVPGIISPQQNQESMNHGPGLYAVSVLPYMQQIPGFTPNTLIPFAYSVPSERSVPENREVGSGQGRQGDQPQQQQFGPQRQVIVRRFQIAIQIDLLLILKLAALIFLFNQDGSRQRLLLLVLFASLVYLYQTGALTPVVRWLSQGMQRAARPPQPPRPHYAPAAQGNDENENENGEMNIENRIDDANEQAEAGEGHEVRNRWWGIVNEIQLIVFGFITSLLPGFHNID